MKLKYQQLLYLFPKNYCGWLLVEVEMSSLPFSVGTHNPTTTILAKLNNNHLPKIESYSLKFHKTNTTTTTTTTCSTNPTTTYLSRREAVGIGFSFGFFQLLNPQPGSAAEGQCEFTAAPSGLAYCDKVVGYGPEAVKGQLIKAHYVGRLEDGKVFDSSYNRGKPLTFRVGVGEVIKGWDQGILGGDGIPAMLAGGKRQLRIPPTLGYGARGAGCKGGSCIIPPDSVLLFDVEFIGKT